MKGFFYWSSLGRALSLFGDKSAGIYIWITPLGAKVLEYTGTFFGGHIHIPVDFFVVFFVAGLFLAAYYLYQWQCPPEHKDVQNMIELLERERPNQERLIELIEVRQRVARAAASIAADVFETSWPGKGLFSDEEQKIIKPILIANYVKGVDTAKAITAALRKNSETNFLTLEEKKPLVRYTIATMLFLSVAGGVGDFFDKALYLIKATI